jgi:hypothetical protein
MSNLSRSIRPAFLLTLFAAAVPQIAAAQNGYLFRQPVGSLSLRFGAAAPSANDDLFKFFSEQLTLNKSSFRTVAFAADIGVRVTPRLDLVIGTSHDRSSNDSEFREWEDTNDQPIEQTTEFERTPITLSAKLYLTDRGQRVAKHAWVPQSLVPYATIGGGYTWYTVEQNGDFVDFETLEIFTRHFESQGHGATFHVGGGAEWWFNPRIALTGDARYAFGSAKLRGDYRDFDNIDLRGLQLTTGLSVRF